ncbi:alpha/beta hydrolase fold protein [Thioalkalivibrio nitratireducens DSM 14787]|uniref:Alpha/beta hydrolase fold protein n=1 Tax=Thioalkalivibrio nitratireducens (strain DSM 14787 / UNIQEM 213 / ALEN2) TaxID=1255043 RepID=L0DU95_THIND|nr:alpha/beta fold hydrolase [Thioalkalivibrio nitratireducens]AGA33174.1 alpha/beta hydrolase fold protein [Thioalkalivibrio nitratireducens DSM 14787]
MSGSRKFVHAGWLALILWLPFAATAAERITLEHDGLTLVGHLQSVSEPADGVVLMLHGTLAHGRMEIMATVQDLLAERGLNSLSVNLSYGIDGRDGMFECDRPVTHGLDAHFAELQAWRAWLADQGYGPVTLLGHSRGGNQIARFYHEYGPGDVRALVLIAPSTYDADRAAADYEAQTGMPLATALGQAEELLRMEQPDTRLTGVRFLYCEELDVAPAAFLAYYRPEQAHDTPTVIDGVDIPALVIIGSEDDVVADLPERMAGLVDDANIASVTIDGADHFFRDFFADDVADAVVDFLD